jgi:hypothetical protein
VASVVTYTLVLGGVFAGALWLVVFAIDKIDWLAQRFSINILPENIPMISLATVWNTLIASVVLIVLLFGVAVVVATPFVLFGRFAIDASQRGKTERIIAETKVVMFIAQARVPSQYLPELQGFVAQLERIQTKGMWFRANPRIPRLKKGGKE